MGNIFFGTMTVMLVALLVHNVDQVIPNNVGYYVEMMLPF
jgi:hypothetical protein